MAKPVGRPTKYKQEYCQLLIDHMAQGYSYETFPAIIDVCIKTIYTWETEYKEFLQAKMKAFSLCQKFWEELGVKHILNESWSEGKGAGGSKSLNASVWIFNMKNRFKWRDRQPDEVIQVTQQVTQDNTSKQLVSELTELLRAKSGPTLPS